MNPITKLGKILIVFLCLMAITFATVSDKVEAQKSEFKVYLPVILNGHGNMATATPTPTATFTSTPKPTITPTPTSTSVSTLIPTLKPTATKIPTSTPTATPTSTGNRAIISITFDDGKNNNYNNAFPIMNARGLTGTFYLVSNWVNGTCCMTDNQIRQMIEAGNEMGSHTVNHPHLPTLNDADLTYELSQSKANLQAKFGPIVDFASPYGEFNDTVVNKIKLYYGSNRSITQGFNIKGNTNPYNILAKSVYSSTSTATVQSWVDYAIANKYWLVLVYHAVADVGDSDTTTLADFTTEMSYLKSTGASIQNMQSALAEWIK